jgi:thiamine biosynthesis lipoprotein
LLAGLAAFGGLDVGGDARVGAHALERFEYQALAMGTRARVVLWAPDEGAARAAAAEAFATIAALEDVCSDWRETSELARLCARAGEGPVAVSPALYEVLELSQEVARASDGAFDVTVGPFSRLWRAARASGEPPADAELDAARALVSWERLELLPEGPAVRLALPGMQLDLGAVAKGYACDRALDVLRERGLARSLVEIGGDLAVGAAPPGRAGWTVAAGCGADGEERVLTLVDAAIATSGDDEQHLDAGGRRWSHVLDPRTGLGLVASPCVSVVARDAATADALASAVSVLGPRACRRLVAAVPNARVLLGEPGLVPLFDGRTLDGWVTRGGRYDGDARWSVEDGALVGRTGANGEGGLLYTERPYTSFVLELETRIDWPFDSGVFVRMAPEGRGAQVTLDWREGGEVGAVYSDDFLAHNEDGAQLFRRGEWNHVEVRCTGFDMRVQAWLNGAPLCDYRVPEGAPGYAPTGLIGLQVHPAGDGSALAARFRDVRVKELPLFGEEDFEPVPGDARGRVRPTAAGSAAGWRALFDGTSLDGWEAHGTARDYRAEDGWLLIPNGGAGELATTSDHEDFRLRLDFRMARMANSGLFLRAARDGSNPAYSGSEIQILDDFDWERVTESRLAPWQLTGSLYGSVPAGDHGVLRRPGEWNTYEVTYRGTRLAAALNGRTLWDVDTTRVPGDPPFAERAPTGFIGLQSHESPHVDGDTVVWFRNLFVQDLDAR